MATITGVEAPLPANASADPNAYVSSVSCASAGNCTAVGSYYDSSGDRQGLLLTQTAGSWANGAEAAPPADAGPDPGVQLSSVSCASAGNCTAVGIYDDSSRGRQGLLLTETAGSWAAGAEAALPPVTYSDPGVELSSVACASAGNCTAVGYYYDGPDDTQGLLLTQNAGSWTTGITAALPASAGSTPGVFLPSVSCASAGNCTAVGGYTDSSGHLQGLLLTQSGGSWAAGAEAALPANAGSAPQVFLPSVSCASAGNCTADGGYVDSSGSYQGLLLTQHAGSWATGTEALLPANAGARQDAAFYSVSCASAGNCTATGDYVDSSGHFQGLLLTQSSGRWATGTEAALPANAGHDIANVLAVSCATPGNCTAVGEYYDNSGNEQGLLLTQSSGSWATGTQAPLPADAAPAPYASGSSVSCASAGNCTAAADYDTKLPGRTQGLLLTQVTPTCSGLTIASQAPGQTGTRDKHGTWSFTVRIRNCTGGVLHAMNLRGSTASWLPGASVTIHPATGTVRNMPHPFGRGQTITWTSFSLPDGATAAITVTVSGTVPNSAACGSALAISHTWTATGLTASNNAVTSGPSVRATIHVMCRTSLASPTLIAHSGDLPSATTHA